MSSVSLDIYSLQPTDIRGVVAAVNGTNPGPSSGISYDVDLNLSAGIRRVFDVVPMFRPWTDPVHTIAAPVGSYVTAVRFGDSLMFIMQERALTLQANCP